MKSSASEPGFCLILPVSSLLIQSVLALITRKPPPTNINTKVDTYWTRFSKAARFFKFSFTNKFAPDLIF